MHCSVNRSHFATISFLFCLGLLELLTVTSSWQITKKCPYGHYYNDGCVTCWCDTNTGHTSCQRSELCNRVNVKCPKGKLYKDECGNTCNCREDSGIVFCSTSNPLCSNKKLNMNKEDMENIKSTTAKPTLPKIQVPLLTPVKTTREVFQPFILRRGTVLKKPVPLYDTDYQGENGAPPPMISLYDKIRRLMSKKIKETIDDVIKDELRKPLENIFHSFPRPIVRENSNSGVHYASENTRPASTSYFPHKPKSTVSETIDDEIPKSVSSGIHEVFVKAPSKVTEEGKKSHPVLNYREKSDNLKESHIREPLFSSEGSESQKVFTFSHPPYSSSTMTPMLSNFEEKMKPNLGNSFHSTSPKPFDYNTFQVNTPSFTYEESTPKAVTMNFLESTPTRPPSFTFDKSTPHFTSAEEVHQSTSQPRIYNIILSTPRPYLYDNQSNSSKPIIRDFVQSSTPQYSNFQYSTARRTFTESTPRSIYHPSTLQPSIYDFEGNSQKYNIYDQAHQPHRNLNKVHQSYIYGASTPSPIFYDFPQSTPKSTHANFIHTTPKTMQRYGFQQNSQKPIIRLIFQQSTARPPSFLVRNVHNNRFSTNKPINTNYPRTTSIADPSRFIFHQKTTKRPVMRLNPTTHKLYHTHFSNHNLPKPSIKSIVPISSTPNMQVNKGSSFVYIFHETLPRNNIHSSPVTQNYDKFQRQPLLQNPSSMIPHYSLPAPTIVPNTFLRNSPRPTSMTKVTHTKTNFISNSQPIFEMTSVRNPSTASYNFEHLSPNPLAHRLEDEIPKPMNFNFQENTPEYVSFNTNYNKPSPNTNSHSQTRRPVVLKYKNWNSAASTPIPANVITSTSATTTTRKPRPNYITTEPMEFKYTPSRAKAAIKIHNHGTRTDNAEYDYNSHKIDSGSSSNPINYSNEGVSASSISPLVNYDYVTETRTTSSSPEQEEEINHEEMIPKELILDPQSGPMTVIFDHNKGQQSLKFSDRKGHEPKVTFSQDNPENPIEVDISKTLVKPTKVDLEDILEKEAEEEYKPVLVDLEKEEREKKQKKTPIVTIKSESGNKNVNEYYQQENQKSTEASTYENEDEKLLEGPMDIALGATPSDIVSYDVDEQMNIKENYEDHDNKEMVSKTEDQLENIYREESLNYEGENLKEPLTYVSHEEQPQEAVVINEYEQEQPSEINREFVHLNPHENVESFTPTYTYTGAESDSQPEKSFYVNQEGINDATLESEVSVSPINFDFPVEETTPANTYDDQGESSHHSAEDNNNHQFMHKTGEEMLSELPLVENEGDVLRFKFTKDERTSKKPLLVSFKKQRRPYKASAYLKTDAVADVFSFYHKMRQESAKRAVATAEKRRLEIPNYDSSISHDDYLSGSRTSTNKNRSNSRDNGSKKVSRGTGEENTKKGSRIHSKSFAEALKTESSSNDRLLRDERDKHNLNRDMADKLDWKLEIEV